MVVVRKLTVTSPKEVVNTAEAGAQAPPSILTRPTRGKKERSIVNRLEEAGEGRGGQGQEGGR